MPIRIEACADRRLCTAAEAYVLGTRRPGHRLLALGPILVGTALLLFADVHAWIFAAALIVVGVVEAIMVPWLLPRLPGPERVREARHPPLLELGDDGVRCVAPGYDLQRPWSMFQRIVELPGQYLLMLSGQHYVSVPTHGLSEGQLADLRILLRDRAPTISPCSRRATAR